MLLITLFPPSFGEPFAIFVATLNSENLKLIAEQGYLIVPLQGQIYAAIFSLLLQFFNHSILIIKGSLSQILTVVYNVEVLSSRGCREPEGAEMFF